MSARRSGKATVSVSATEKKVSNGYDEAFDGRTFATAVALLAPTARPKLWPAGPTRMRSRVAASAQGMKKDTEGSAFVRQVMGKKQPSAVLTYVPMSADSRQWSWQDNSSA